MTRHNFREILATCKTIEQVELFRRISPYFPLAKRESILDLSRNIKKGGTFCGNFNFTAKEVNIVIESIREYGSCECFFLVPIPSPEGFTDPVQIAMIALAYLSIAQGRSSDHIPYFSLHCSSSWECAKGLVGLIITKLHDDNAYIRETFPEKGEYADKEMSAVFKRIGIKPVL